jgi:orotidine-5'-phosphate decarboxylase
MPNPIIVALDFPDPAQALKLTRDLAGLVGAFKAGKELFISGGPDVVRLIRDTGAEVFLDLKLHDIPNTVAAAVAAAVRLDVQMLTLHTCGGSTMLKAAVEAAGRTATQLNRTPPLLLGVTVLTSMDANALVEVGVEGNVGRQVERLANLAVQSGLGGLVCSPLEIASLRQFLPSAFQLVTPGIRSGTEPADDQRRTLSAREALLAGANRLVIGRPIHTAADPRAATHEILRSLE